MSKKNYFGNLSIFKFLGIEIFVIFIVGVFLFYKNRFRYFSFFENDTLPPFTDEEMDKYKNYSLQEINNLPASIIKRFRNVMALLRFIDTTYKSSPGENINENIYKLNSNLSEDQKNAVKYATLELSKDPNQPQVVKDKLSSVKWIN